jgi:uncharacterized protein (DUF2384 family)
MTDHDSTGENTGDNQDDAPRPKRIFRGSRVARIPPDAAQRQGHVTRLALDAFGNKDAAIAYLNTESESLGGRPIALATTTADGLRSVEQDLAVIRSATSSGSNSA